MLCQAITMLQDIIILMIESQVGGIHALARESHLIQINSLLYLVTSFIKISLGYTRPLRFLMLDCKKTPLILYSFLPFFSSTRYSACDISSDISFISFSLLLYYLYKLLSKLGNNRVIITICKILCR